ncbi:MAG: PhoH family protein [Armatimonadetes bacterium]|nr:PhoH family protein [Armatimonadota bacterium]
MRYGGRELETLVGHHDQNLKLIEDQLGVRIVPRDDQLQIFGDEQAAQDAEDLLQRLLEIIRRRDTLSDQDLKYALRAVQREAVDDTDALLAEPLLVTPRGKPIRPKTAGQMEYVRAMVQDDVVFCIGPAGTGKTYLAMAMAVRAMKEGSVSRIVLTRPIVEAGEELGFLPGDLMEKVDPYLRPLYDALIDVIGADRLQRHLRRGTIEVVPLAYMRGRTINDAIIVLDEAQNTSIGQTKMALTRMGLASRMIVTGDITQVDLPASVSSGLAHAIEILEKVPGIAVCRLTGHDIVRHDLVQQIVEAYDQAQTNSGDSQRRS